MSSGSELLRAKRVERESFPHSALCCEPQPEPERDSTGMLHGREKRDRSPQEHDLEAEPEPEEEDDDEDARESGELALPPADGCSAMPLGPGPEMQPHMPFWPPWSPYGPLQFHNWPLGGGQMWLPPWQGMAEAEGSYPPEHCAGGLQGVGGKTPALGERLDWRRHPAGAQADHWPAGPVEQWPNRAPPRVSGRGKLGTTASAPLESTHRAGEPAYVSCKWWQAEELEQGPSSGIAEGLEGTPTGVPPVPVDQLAEPLDSVAEADRDPGTEVASVALGAAGHAALLTTTRAFTWAVPTAKFRLKDKTIVSKPFFAEMGGVRVPFLVQITASKLNDRRGGHSFKKAKGCGKLELICKQAPPRALAPVEIAFVVGGERRGPMKHNFAESSLCSLPREQEEWDFLADPAAQCVTISIEIPDYEVISS